MATKKRGGGRPEFVPTDRQRGMVQGMALWNVPVEHIRLRIFKADGKNLNLRTFLKAFKNELEEAHTNVETNVATAMYKRSLGNFQGSQKAGEFILSCKFGWSTEGGGSNGQLGEGTHKAFKNRGLVDQNGQPITAITRRIVDPKKESEE
jgi:hypothetical protein